jgi:hypothetical protein
MTHFSFLDKYLISKETTMKLITALILALSFGLASANDTKTVDANGKKIEARVPKSAKIDCKDKANADKVECKKASKEMPKVEKPKETAPADAKKK